MRENGKWPKGSGKRTRKDEFSPQDKFACHRYSIHGVKERAIQEAFPHLNGRSAMAKANRFFKKTHINEYLSSIASEIHGSKDKVVDAAKMVLDELDLIGFSDIKDYFPEGSKEAEFLKGMGKKSRAIESFEITDDLIGGVVQRKTIKFKLHSKVKSLELRGKNLKLYTDMIQGVIVTKPEVYVPDNGRNVARGKS